MRFPLKYVLWLTLPPGLIGISFALFFLRNAAPMPSQTWGTVVAVTISSWLIAGLLYSLFLYQRAAAVEAVIATERDPSAVVSSTLQETTIASLFLWVGVGGALAFTAIAALDSSFRGIQVFLIAAMIVAAPAMAFNYWASKSLLLNHCRESASLEYTGRPWSIRAKIAMVFIGFFAVSAGALVQLVSSRVEDAFEARAVIDNTLRLEKLKEAVGEGTDRALISRLAAELPDEYALHVVQPNGETQSEGGTLTSGETNLLIARRSGDTRRSGTETLMLFEELRNGAILALAIPYRHIHELGSSIAVYGLVIVLITTILFAISTWFLARDLTKPVQKLSAVALQMAEGNFEQRVRVFSDDEVGVLGRAISTTRGTLSNLIARIGTSGVSVSQGVRAMSGGTATLLDGAKEQASLTDRARMAVESVNQQARIVIELVGGVQRESTDVTIASTELQAAAEEISSQTSVLFRAVEKISSSSHEIDASAREMSSRSELLSRINEEVVAFVNQMQATLEEFRRTAESTAEISYEVRNDATLGGGAVSATVEGIQAAQKTITHTANVLEELHAKVRRIDEVLMVIEELMNRTNLLALNAAIIAAQAGQHESGFTVIADEIRQLADRTRTATKEISVIVHSVQPSAVAAVTSMREGVRQVQDTVALADRASASLRKISASSEKSSAMAEQVSRSIKEQAIAGSHLREVTSRLSEHTSEIDRAIQSQALATQLLAKESEKVRDVALLVRTATDEQKQAAAQIAQTMEKTTDDVKNVRGSLEEQLAASAGIAAASQQMYSIAQNNDGIAQQFNSVLNALVSSGAEFEKEASRFRLATSQ